MKGKPAKLPQRIREGLTLASIRGASRLVVSFSTDGKVSRLPWMIGAQVPSRSLKTSLALWKYVTELRRAATRHLTELGLPEVRLIAVFSSLPEGIEISEQVGLLITPHERELWTTPLLKRLDLEAGFPDPECHAQAFGIVARWTRTVALASKERAGPDATSSAVRALARQVTDADPKNAGAIAYVDVYLDVSNAWVSMFY